MPPDAQQAVAVLAYLLEALIFKELLAQMDRPESYYARIRENLTRFLTIEIFSFGVLSATAWPLMDHHHFIGAIVCFSLGCFGSATLLVLLTAEIPQSWMRFLAYMIILSAVFFGGGYFIGIVNETSDGYYSALIKQEVVASAAAGKPEHKNALAPPTTPIPSPVPKPRSVVDSKLYPIIVATAAQVTNDVTANKIEIVVTLGNETATKVNAHITTQTFLNDRGVETQLGPTDERDIGFAPPPFLYQVRSEMQTTSSGDSNLANGLIFLKVVMSVTYPDRSGKTTYRFIGKTKPNSDKLDYMQSDWEYKKPYV